MRPFLGASALPGQVKLVLGRRQLWSRVGVLARSGILDLKQPASLNLPHDASVITARVLQISRSTKILLQAPSYVSRPRYSAALPRSPAKAVEQDLFELALTRSAFLARHIYVGW
jgi:hypothetical protein